MKILITFTLILIMFGCGATSITLNVYSSSALNMDANNNALPVIIKIYELTDVTAFRKASFRQLWKEDAQVLGDSLLNKQILAIKPNSHKQIKIQQHKQAKYIAVMAVFRKPNKDGWRSYKLIPTLSSYVPGLLAIKLNNNKVTILRD